MSRPKGSKNRKTLAREALIKAKLDGVTVDSLEFMQQAVDYYASEIHRLVMGYKGSRMKAAEKDRVIRTLYLDGVRIAEKIATFRYPKMSTVKLIGDPRAPVSIDNGATKEQLRNEILTEAADILQQAQALGVVLPEGVANRITAAVGGKTLQ